MTDSSSSSSGSGSGSSAGSAIGSLVGPLSSAVAGYYAARNRKFLLRAQAMTLEFEGSLADLNARAAERDAEAIFADGRYEKARAGMIAAMDVGEIEAGAAAAGIQAGVGSAAEAVASRKYAAAMDQRAIGINSAREVSVARTRAVNARNAGMLNRTSAANVRRMNATINAGRDFHIGLGNGLTGVSGAGQSSGGFSSYYSRGNS